MPYVPNATDPTQPTEDKTVESAALEFRTVKGELSRTLKFPAGESASYQGPLPASTARAGRFLAFDSVTGKPVAGPLLSAWTVTQAQIADISEVADNMDDVQAVVADMAAITAAPAAAAAAEVSRLAAEAAAGAAESSGALYAGFLEDSFPGSIPYIRESTPLLTTTPDLKYEDNQRVLVGATAGTAAGTPGPGVQVGDPTNTFTSHLLLQTATNHLCLSADQVTGATRMHWPSTKVLTFGHGTPNLASFTELARVTASNSWLFGTTTATSNARVVAYSATGPTIASVRTTSATETHVTFTNAFGTVGSITTTANNTSYNTSSDYRLKNITGPITTSGAYIDSLNPVEGTWIQGGSVFVGLLAHEAQAASRTPVATGEHDGEEMQALCYASPEMIANMAAELKSLRIRVAALEA